MFSCQISFCRYCSIQEIQSYYCRNCLENNNYSNDAYNFRGKCSKCVECPNCSTILTIIVSADPNNDEEQYESHRFKHLTYLNSNRIYYFYCQYCFWDSKKLKIAEKQLEKLLGPYYPNLYI